MIADGDAMGVAPEITEHRFGSSESGFGVHHPVQAEQFVHEGLEAGCVSEMR